MATIRLIPERFRWRPRRDPDGTMSLVEHLEELRHRLLISVIALGIAGIAGWFLFDPIVNLLQNPYCRYWVTVPERVRPTKECTFFFFGALEPAVIKFKLVGFIALFLALPVLLYQLWAFIVPGLTQRERRLAIPFVVSSVFLFALGAAFAYWTLPKALGFLLGFAGQQFAPLLTGDRYLSFVMLVALLHDPVRDAAHRGDAQDDRQAEPEAASLQQPPPDRHVHGLGSACHGPRVAALPSVLALDRHGFPTASSTGRR